MISLHQLEYFMKIVEKGTFSAAAQALFMTQSSLSKQIVNLEKDLNVTLFDRSSRNPQLTHGQHLYRRIPDILAPYYELIKELHPSLNELTLAVLPVLEAYDLTKYLTDFSLLYPSIQMAIEEKSNQDIPLSLKQGICELGIFRTDYLDNEHWHYQVLNTDELVLVLPKNHPFASRSSCSLSELANENFILLDNSTSLYQSSVNACKKAGFTPRIIYKGASANTICRMVENGNGIAISMKEVAYAQKNSTNVVLPFIETEQKHLILAYPKGHSLSEPAKLFWNYMKGKSS